MHLKDYTTLRWGWGLDFRLLNFIHSFPSLSKQKKEKKRGAQNSPKGNGLV
jgi:hypothetical protein